MKRKTSSVRNVSFILIIIQLICLVTFVVFYFLDLFELKKIVKPEFVIIGASSLVFLDCLFLWIVTLVSSSLRYKNDLHAAEVIGNDVQEAYNFAMLGLAVVDDNDTVIWTNELFADRHIEIVDVNIFEWQPTLKNLKDSGEERKTVKIEFNSRNYEVEYLQEAGLFIFKDSTDYEQVLDYSKQQAPVVGLIKLDNYADVVKNDDDFNDMVTKVKNVIFQYAMDFRILLRRHSNDTYLMLSNYESLQKMKNDNFSILGKVRDIGSGQDNHITLSIGIAHKFPDVVKLNDLASDALGIAMSRGGDQVVLSTYGSGIEFIGGKTEAQENRNRVKIRVNADSLFKIIENSNNVVVMGHDQMDMDSLGACLGIKAISSRFEKECYAVLDLKRTETKTRSAITSSFSREELESIFISPKEAVNIITPNSLLVIVDVHTQNMTMAPELFEQASKIVVIDHHRRGEDYVDSPILDCIDSSASSASEIIAEFIKYGNSNPRIDLPSSFATIMLAGIFLDTGYFKSKSCGMRAFEAASILKEYGADNALAYDLLKDDFEEYTAINTFISNRQTPIPGVVYCYVDDHIHDSATIAKAANTCLMMKSVKAAFAIGLVSNKDVRMSCRSDGTINVQLIAEKMGGGGHYSSAAVSFEKKDIKSVIELLTKTLNENIDDARNDSFSSF